MIKDCNIWDYSIYLRQLPDGDRCLFSYLEYAGADFAADIARMPAAPETQRWREFCKPCQIPLANRAEGEWWEDMQEEFHLS